MLDIWQSSSLRRAEGTVLYLLDNCSFGGDDFRSALKAISRAKFRVEASHFFRESATSRGSQKHTHVFLGKRRTCIKGTNTAFWCFVLQYMGEPSCNFRCKDMHHNCVPSQKVPSSRNFVSAKQCGTGNILPHVLCFPFWRHSES